MKLKFLLIILLCPFALLCQKKFSLEANYGLNGNFFVRSYDQESRNVPGVAEFFYKKNFIGTIGGTAIKYRIGKKSSLSLGFSRSINSRVINFSGAAVGAPIDIDEFTIRHVNNFYELGFNHQFLNLGSNLEIESGIYYLRMNQQEVSVSTFGAQFQERKFKNNRLEEGGFFLGFHYSKQIENRFRVGIRSRLYYTASTNQFEAITLTPTLSYHF